METLSFKISEELSTFMKNHPEINQKEIAKLAIEEYIRKIEMFDELFKDSEFTELDAEEFSELVKESVYKKMMEQRNPLK